MDGFVLVLSLFYYTLHRENMYIIEIILTQNITLYLIQESYFRAITFAIDFFCDVIKTDLNITYPQLYYIVL